VAAAPRALAADAAPLDPGPPAAPLDPGPPAARLDEAELLARWSTGNVAAGQRLFREYYNVVSRYLSNKVGGAVHGDLVQRTFLACLTGAAQLGGTSSFRTFLLRIAHRELAEHLRRARRGGTRAPEREVDLEALIVADSFAEPHAVAAQQQEHRLLLAALRRLPFALQAVLELHYWESLSPREIAEVLGAPIGTVKTQLRHGRVRLRRELASSDVTLDLLRSTLDLLEGWSERVRSELGIFHEARRAAGSSPDPAAATRTTDAAEPPAPTPAPAPREAGQAGIGRYVVERRLGVGAASVVYAARDTVLDRPVALKVMGRRDADGAWSERLRREIRALARLQHPHVVAVYDVGEWRGHLFLAMELVIGETLEQWQAARPRAVPELLRRYLAAGRGLEAAHAAELLHRSFKPSNVLLAEDGRVVVADFGLAEPASAPCPSEDVRGFSAALCEALIGQRPPPGLDLRRALKRTALPWRARAALERGAAADPAQRWPRLTPLLAELEAALRKHQRRPREP
jgi:RNA polymerase sigma factor (sigma-70 family)